MGNYVKKKFPYLKEVILAQNRKTAVISGHALTRNVSRRAQAFRKFKKAEEAAHKFQVIPIIIRMQRDWREYLNIKHSKREIGAAVALLKRMRANAKSGAELFKELKDEHMKEVSHNYCMVLGHSYKLTFIYPRSSSRWSTTCCFERISPNANSKFGECGATKGLRGSEFSGRRY